MKKIQGMFIPDRDNHFHRWMNSHIIDGFGTYHYSRLLKSLKYVKNFNCAIDIGAHIGLWSVPLSREFKKVIAFEPDKDNLECLLMNSHNKITIHSCALGNISGTTLLEQDTKNTGKSCIVQNSLSNDQVSIRKLDVFNLKPDYIKIDCEGYELFVLQGAEKTLRENHPVIVVEVGPSQSTDRYSIKEKGSLRFLKSLGAVVRENIKHDYILSWD